MKTHFLVILAIVGLLPCLALSKSGPEIPRPKTPLCDAVRAVEDYFFNKFEPDDRSPESDRFVRECIVFTANYTNVYQRDFEEHRGDRDIPLGEWSWVITIVHPRQNDHTWVFHLRRDGTIKLLEHSI